MRTHSDPTFILHTVDYAAIRQRVADRFVHHVPTDKDDKTPGGAAAARPVPPGGALASSARPGQPSAVQTGPAR
ncbi:hypothetical protein OIA45_47765 (plasmid) [Streptomyces chartreusis]|uniref:hypothetical protein n=1 Tax=Streptomyces chartreusis TaxID=1969 RepID=UPI00386878DA|nr:hypothetical protein OIA45_47765 [Streptomyces chartreusis]